MTKPKGRGVPVPIKSEARICFAISWFKVEEHANQYAKEIVRQGRTYNGGFFHGMPCGRDASFDYEDKELGKLYAVTE